MVKKDCRVGPTLDARRLRVFKAVFDHGSITAAAAALGYSPSAVSQSISTLEREAKIALFEKSGRGIRPTQAAELLAKHADSVLEDLRQAEEDLTALRSGQAGRMRVAAFATAGAWLVPQALASFTRKHSGVTCQLVIAETDDALNQLDGGQIEVAVVALEAPAIEDAGSRILHPLLEDPYRIVLSPSHPLASQSPIDLGQLQNERWIATASARCNCLPTIIEACARDGFVPRFAIEADEFATTLGFVAAGLGIAMVPELALGFRPPGVSVHQIGQRAEPKRHVYAAARSRDSGQPTIASMLDALDLSAGDFVRMVA